MEYMSSKDAARIWGISLRRVQNLCKEGRIPGVVKFNEGWMLPVHAERPEDLRRKESDQNKVTEEKKQKEQGFLLPEKEKLETPDYRKILAADYREMRFRSIQGIPFVEFVCRLMEECPLSVREQYPLAMLQMAYALTGIHSRKGLLKIMIQEVQESIRKLPEGEEKDQLLGEHQIIMAFLYYPDFSRMESYFHRARKLCVRRIRCIDVRDSLTMCGFPVLPVFYRGEYRQKEQRAALNRILADTQILAEGWGAGLSQLWEADELYYQGKVEQAKNLAYEVLYISRNYSQSSVELGALELLCHIAIHSNDNILWEQSLDDMKHLIANDREQKGQTQIMFELIRSELYNAIGLPGKVDEWLRKGRFDLGWMPDILYATALYIHIAYLFHTEQYVRQQAAVKTRPDFLDQETPQIVFYMKMFQAAACNAQNHPEECLRIYTEAMNRFPEEHVLLNCAEFYWLMRRQTDHYLQERPEFKKKVEELRGNFGLGWTNLNAKMNHHKLPGTITKREYEVAMMAAKGLTNREIAQALNLSEHTVRAHLRNVFEKLSIDRRNAIIRKLQE